METEHVELYGLDGQVMISIDRWGIAHISALTKRDVFFAQGYNAARDRLWQIDLWRKRGLGLLASDFGPGYLEQDRAARLFLYRGDMEAEWAAYCDDAKEIATAFVAGINAYVAETEAGRQVLPAEFDLAGTRPARWDAEDVVRIRSHSMMRNALSEVIRANVLSRASLGADELRQALVPAKVPFVAEGLALDEIPLAVADVFKLALAPVTFEKERLSASLDEATLWFKVTGTADIVRDAGMQGSNNWVVHGSRTESGRPILANDPHRTHAVPSLRYLVHLKCPEFDVIGAGEPCLPGICIGHNGTSAFGLTLFYGTDQEDVYVYEVSHRDGTLYRYDGGWERMRVLDETVTLKDGSKSVLRLCFTRHGPVVYRDSERNRAYAIRSVWFEPGTAPYFASIASMRTRRFEDFRSAMGKWGVPATNQVYADAGGDVGWLVAGFSPIRSNWDGLLPVPGDGRFEWSGFMPPDKLPYALNPESGFIATANEANLPRDWDHDSNQIGYEWLEPSRAHRIAEVLSDSDHHTVSASASLQTDTTSLVARRLATLLGEIKGASSEIREVCEEFAVWDKRLEADSPAALLFEVWWSGHLRPALIEAVSDDDAVRSLLQPGDPASVLALLERPDHRLGVDPIPARDRLLSDTLTAALHDCDCKFGHDRSAWQWGKLHQVHFIHALSSIASGSSGLKLDVGPYPLGGSDSSPMNASYRMSDYGVTVGASVRLVIDVGDWDSSICINSPGQAGSPEASHYSDLASLWAQGDYVPLIYSSERVEDETVTRFLLRPLTELRT